MLHMLIGSILAALVLAAIFAPLHLFQALIIFVVLIIIFGCAAIVFIKALFGNK